MSQVLQTFEELKRNKPIGQTYHSRQSSHAACEHDERSISSAPVSSSSTGASRASVDRSHCS